VIDAEMTVLNAQRVRWVERSDAHQPPHIDVPAEPTSLLALASSR
jgi:hypothetical protein